MGTEIQQESVTSTESKKRKVLVVPFLPPTERKFTKYLPLTVIIAVFITVAYRWGDQHLALIMLRSRVIEKILLGRLANKLLSTEQVKDF